MYQKYLGSASVGVMVQSIKLHPMALALGLGTSWMQRNSLLLMLQIPQKPGPRPGSDKTHCREIEIGCMEKKYAVSPRVTPSDYLLHCNHGQR